MSSWTPTDYKIKNRSNENRPLKQHVLLSIWFGAETARVAAIQGCLAMKVLFDLTLRQTAGFVGSLLEFIGLVWSVSNFDTLCRWQKTLAIVIPYRG